MNLLKKTMKKSMVVCVAVMMFFSSVPVSAASNYMANNIYITPVGQRDSDIITADWMTGATAKNTYWSLYNWSANSSGATSGYAGFQDTTSGHKSIISLWTSPINNQNSQDIEKAISVEYKNDSLGAVINTFNNEGSGINCITPYKWNVGNWYRMTVRSWTDTDNNCTYIGQWIKDIKNGKWDLVVKFKINEKVNQAFGECTGFQEDFGSSIDGLREGCFKNYGQRPLNSSIWRMLSTAEVYIPYFDNKCGNAQVLDCNAGYYNAITQDGDFNNTPDYSINQYTIPVDQVYQEKFTTSISSKSYTSSSSKIKTVINVPKSSTPIFKYNIVVFNSNKLIVASTKDFYPNKASNKITQYITKKLTKGSYVISVNAEDIFGKTSNSVATLNVN